jgi:hypothetical protein
MVDKSKKYCFYVATLSEEMNDLVENVRNGIRDHIGGKPLKNSKLLELLCDAFSKEVLHRQDRKGSTYTESFQSVASEVLS